MLVAVVYNIVFLPDNDDDDFSCKFLPDYFSSFFS